MNFYCFKLNTKHKKNGYRLLESVCLQNNMVTEDQFIFEGEKHLTAKARPRLFISSECCIMYLKDKADSVSQNLLMKLENISMLAASGQPLVFKDSLRVIYGFVTVSKKTDCFQGDYQQSLSVS